MRTRFYMSRITRRAGFNLPNVAWASCPCSACAVITRTLENSKIYIAQSTGKMPVPQKSSPNPQKKPFPYGFTLIEMLMALIIMALVAALIMPVMGVVGDATSTRAAKRTVAVAVETARQIVNEQSKAKKDKPLPSDPSIIIPWSGAAALFTASGQVRFVECNQFAHGPSGWLGADGNPYHAYADVSDRSYMQLPTGRSIVGMIHVNGNLRLIAPPFAVRFDKSGVLVSGDPVNPGYSKTLVIYDGDYDQNYGGVSFATSFGWPVLKRPSGYEKPSGSELWNNNRYVTAFEQIESVFGVVLFDSSSPDIVDLQGDSNGYIKDTAQQKILKRGTVLIFNRYTGVPARRLSHEK